MILNVCVPDDRTSKLVKPRDEPERSNGQIHPYSTGPQHSTLRHRRTSRPKSSQDLEELNTTIHQQDLTDIQRRRGGAAHLEGQRRGPHPGRGTDLSKFRRIGFIPCVLSDQKELKPEVSNRKTTGESPNVWRLNNTLLNK